MKKCLVSPSVITVQHGFKVLRGYFLLDKHMVRLFPGLGNPGVVVASRMASLPTYLVTLSLTPGLTRILSIALSLKCTRSRVPGENKCETELPAQQEK